LFPVGTTAVLGSARDGINTGSGSFTVRVVAPAAAENHAPVAQDASYAVKAGTSLCGVLKGWDPDGIE
jgi:hypothetical protein